MSPAGGTVAYVFVVQLTAASASMTSSDGDFDDDDDDFLLSLNVNAQSNSSAATLVSLSSHAATKVSAATGLDAAVQARLYRADGEIAILREKYLQLERQRLEEVNRLRAAQASLQRQSQDQVQALQFTVQKLEDEKKFLANDLQGLLKRRRVDVKSGTPEAAAVATAAPKRSPQKVIRIENDTLLFMEHIWRSCESGGGRRTLDILNKVYLESDLCVGDLSVPAKVPIAGAIVDFLMLKRSLRLDDAVTQFTLTLVDTVTTLLESSAVLAVPFLLGLVHAAITFRPLAVVQSTVTQLLERLSAITSKHLFLLEEAQNQEESYHDVPEQVLVLENWTLVCCGDIIEKLASIASLHGAQFTRQLQKDGVIGATLLQRLLPNNSERYKTTSQINLVYNVVEIVMSGIAEHTDPGVEPEVPFESICKVFLLDIPLRDTFMFHGLNRCVGNNIDMNKVVLTVPLHETELGYTTVSIPCPIPHELALQRCRHQTTPTRAKADLLQDKLQFELFSRHQHHILLLRTRVATLIEHYILTTLNVGPLQLRDHIKSMVRTIGLEQEAILATPRSKHIHIRTQIIGTLVRILHYVSSDCKGGITTLVYPETMYEVFVVLSRIAFGSTSLSMEAHAIVADIRLNAKYFLVPLFHQWCETWARQLNHIEPSDADGKDPRQGAFIADVESQYANGLEFPFEEETIELAREILDICVTHEEADNLFFNMNSEEDVQDAGMTR